MIALEKVTEKTPPGTSVALVKDNGSVYLTRTRSDAWWLNHHLLVQVEGIPGGYLAERCHVLPVSYVPSSPSVE